MDWLQWITASGAVGALGVAVATYLRTRPAMKTAQIQGETALWARIAALEAESQRERERCDTALAEMRATIGDLRHDLAAETSSLDAFLMLAEADPDKVFQALPRIREERRQHKERMALKRGVREGTVIGGIGRDGL